jgi:hypothetical protein
VGFFRRKRHGNTHGDRYRRVDRNTACDFYTARVLTNRDGNTHRHKYVHAYDHLRSAAQQYAHIDLDTDPQPNRDNRADRYTDTHSNGYYRAGTNEHGYAYFNSLACANNTCALSENRMYNPPPC